MLVWWHAHFCGRCLLPPVLDDVARLWRHRWHRPRAGLHLARQHPDQMVPRPPWHGHRHGHHGLWWWRHDWLALGCRVDESICHRPRSGCLADLRDHGLGVLRVHDGGRFGLPHSCHGLETYRLDAPCTAASQHHDHPRPCACQQSLGHSPVLDGLGGVVHECVCRHWRDRHGQPHVARSFWRRLDGHRSQVC